MTGDTIFVQYPINLNITTTYTIIFDVRNMWKTLKRILGMLTCEILKSLIAVKKSENKSISCINHYLHGAKPFVEWLESNNINDIESISPDNIREYVNLLSQHRNKSSTYTAYASIKSMFIFYENEYEPQNYKNPIRKVKILHPKTEPIEGISLVEIKRVLDLCSKDNRGGIRNKAIFLLLASSGVRKMECLNLNVEDVNLIDGTVIVRKGKGGKRRITYISKESRRALRKYLSIRKNINDSSPLFVSEENERLSQMGMVYIFKKYNCKFGPHGFRRFFALSLFRKNVSILLISILLGHANINQTRTYLAIEESDLRIAHMQGDFFD